MYYTKASIDNIVIIHVYRHTYVETLPLRYLVELLPEWLNTEKQQIHMYVRIVGMYIRTYVCMQVYNKHRYACNLWLGQYV